MVLDRAEWEPANGPHELFELAGQARIDRPMARIMRARRDLVDEDGTALRHEHLDRENPDEIELFGDVTRDRLGAYRGVCRNSRGRDRRVEDMIDMLVFDRRIGRPSAVCAARNDDRDLTGKIDKAFEDAALSAHSPPSFLGLDLGGQSDLTLAVIAQTHRLQHGGVTEIVHRAEQGGWVGNVAVSGSLDVDRAKEVLLVEPVLRDFEDFRPRQHRFEGRHPADCLRRNIFEFEGYYVDSAREPL